MINILFIKLSPTQQSTLHFHDCTVGPDWLMRLDPCGLSRDYIAYIGYSF